MKLLEIHTSTGNYLAKKYVFLGDNGYTVSSIYVDRIDKDIICVSCMYGCPVGCVFCKSGENYHGNISSEDMNFMCDYIAKDNKFSDEKRKVFSFMGSGEPLLNYHNVHKTINYIHLTYKRYSVSVSLSGIGVLKNFKYFIQNMYSVPKIQFSLHSPFDGERKLMIPNSDNIDSILDVLDEYSRESNTYIELNYILLEGINDTPKHADELSKLIINNDKFLLKINEYHEINNTYGESKHKKAFINYLNFLGIVPEIYSTDGVDIGAACGQLNTEKLC